MQIIREIPRNFYVYDVQTTLVYTFMLMRHNLGQLCVRITEISDRLNTSHTKKPW